MNVPMDIVRLHERALDEAARLVDGVRPDQMGLSTPCTEWDVRTLIAHLVGGNVRFLDVAEGKPRPERGPVTQDVLGDDPAGAYRRSAEALKQAWRDPARLDQQCQLPFGVMPGRAALGLHLVETVAHAWEPGAAACGRPLHAPGPGWVARATTCRCCDVRRPGPVQATTRVVGVRHWRPSGPPPHAHVESADADRVRRGDTLAGGPPGAG